MKLKKNVIMVMITQQSTTTLAEMELKEQLMQNYVTNKRKITMVP